MGLKVLLQLGKLHVLLLEKLELLWNLVNLQLLRWVNLWRHVVGFRLLKYLLVVHEYLLKLMRNLCDLVHVILVGLVLVNQLTNLVLG